MTDSPLVFDELAEEYDAWFLANPNVLASEVALLAAALGERPGRTLSVGCGSGLFEDLLRRHHDIDVRDGVEPAVAMAEIARRRGMTVEIAGAERLPVPDEGFDTVMLNGCPSYLDDLDAAVAEAFRALRSGGRIVVADVPAESSFGLLYSLAGEIGSWDAPRFAGSAPRSPYPAELAASARWRTTPDKVRRLEDAGFLDLRALQTLTRHPVYSDDAVEEPSEGYDRGDYVALVGGRP